MIENHSLIPPVIDAGLDAMANDIVLCKNTRPLWLHCYFSIVSCAWNWIHSNHFFFRERDQSKILLDHSIGAEGFFPRGHFKSQNNLTRLIVYCVVFVQLQLLHSNVGCKAFAVPFHKMQPSQYINSEFAILFLRWKKGPFHFEMVRTAFYIIVCIDRKKKHFAHQNMT